MSYKILRLTGHVLAWLSPRWVERLSFGLAVFVFDILRIRRGVILRNLEIAFGSEKSKKELRRIGRMSVYHFILNMAEFFRSVDIDIAKDITMVDREHIDQARLQGKGIYTLCFHMGNWEAMGAKYTRDICPSHILVKQVGHGGVQRFINDQRAHNRFLWVKRQQKGDGFKAIQNILNANEVVGFVIDQARPGEPRLPFFGEPAKTNTSFAAIWARHEAPIVPSYILRSGIGKHTVYFLPELKLTKSDDPHADIIAHSSQFNKVVEHVIRTCPEQYFWMHNRWK